MMPNYDRLVAYESAPAIAGPFSANSLMLDQVTVAPFEGVWIPTRFIKTASIEITGANTPTFSGQLWGTNAIAPVNQQLVTVGGSVSTSDVNTLTFNSPVVQGGSIAVTYTAIGGDGTTQVGAGLAAAINANTKLAAIAVTATASLGVVTVSWPSVAPAITAPTYTNPVDPGRQNVLTITGSTTGSETFTIANGSTGTSIGNAITALGFTLLTMTFRHFKFRLNSLSGASASVSAQFQGNG